MCPGQSVAELKENNEMKLIKFNVLEHFKKGKAYFFDDLQPFFTTCHPVAQLTITDQKSTGTIFTK